MPDRKLFRYIFPVLLRFDEAVKSRIFHFAVIPANGACPGLDPGVSSYFKKFKEHWTPVFTGVTTFYETIKKIGLRNINRRKQIIPRSSYGFQTTMPHSVTLITTFASALGLALVPGFVAVRFKLPALVGYLVAGVMLGPATPGFVADVGLSRQLAEIGVMLLMFGVGLHFSVEDLMTVRRIALPGAIAQIAVATMLGMAVSSLWGWSPAAGIVFGLALSVASTVVLLRSKLARVLERIGERKT